MKKLFDWKSNLILPAIAGYSDAPARALALKYGAGIAYTEMISCKGLLYNNANTLDMLYTLEEESPQAIQLFGSEPEVFKRTLSLPELNKFSYIDVNMGCPVRKIVTNGEGSALLRDADKAYEIVKVLSEFSNGRKISVKIRLGIDSRFRAVEVAEAIESGGADFIIVHGRTREMFYSGNVDYEGIKKVKEAVKIPVIGNGDVVDTTSYLKMLETGVDGVAIARGAIGAPFIFSLLQGIPYKFDIQETLIFHLEELSKYLSYKAALNNFKGQFVYYVRGIQGNKKLKEDVLRIKTVADMLEYLKNIEI